MKKSIRIFLAIALVTSFLIAPFQVSANGAQTLGDLEDNLNALKKKKQDNENSKKYTQQQIAEKNAAISKANEEMGKAKLAIEEAQRQIEESNIKIEELKLESEKLLQFQQQMQSQNAYLEYVSGASSTTEMIMRYAVVQQIADYNTETLQNLEDLINENYRMQEELTKKNEELQGQIEAYRNTILKYEDSLDDFDKYAVDIDSQIKTSQDLYNYYKGICANNPTTATQGRAAKLVDCETTMYNANWTRPLKSGTVTSEIGTRWGSYHNALDIGGNPEGTPIYAAAAGYVAEIYYRYYCGGNMVYINVNVGGKLYTTYYYHLLEIKVTKGQKVTQDTIIGTVGGGRSTSSAYGGYDTCSTGAHLHYGVSNGYFSGSIKKANVITPPGFNNSYGFKFSSRYFS